MHHLIQQKLTQIAQEQNINILFACESGSRAWGFPSPNSDYDVRFIYRHTKNRYLSIIEPEPQLNFPLDEHEIDLAGWDLKKSLQLTHKSNSTIFEWLQSPIIYQEKNHFQQRLFAVCAHYFNQKINIHHYLGIANSATKSLQNQQIAIKKLFYILRPLLAAKWCMQNNSIAPMTIQPLCALLPASLQSYVQQLIKEKITLPEQHSIQIPSELLAFIEETTTVCRTFANNLTSSAVDEQQLNRFFLTELAHDD